jgi:hypothetical protein
MISGLGVAGSGNESFRTCCDPLVQRWNFRYKRWEKSSK